MGTAPNAASKPHRPTRSAAARSVSIERFAAQAATCARCGEHPASGRTSPFCDNCANELGTLWHEDEIRHEMLTLVYDELIKDPDVRADLDALLDQIRPLVKDSPFVSASPSPVARAPVEAFVAKWHLRSSFGAIEVWGSVADAARSRFPWEKAMTRLRLRPIPLGVRYANERRRSEAMNRITITVHAPEPFIFDPTTMSRDQMKRFAELAGKKLQRDILAEVDSVVRAWRNTFQGWRPVPTRYRKPNEMRRIARRIARAMLGWSAPKIARTERLEEASDAGSADAVRKTLGEWLPKLEIGPLGGPRGQEL